MYQQYITPVTTKLSFTNASDTQRSTSPISTISFYSNTTTIGNSSQRTDSSLNDVLKSSIYFDYPTPPNPHVERTSSRAQDNFHLENISIPSRSLENISTTHNDYQAFSPEYCPKTPVYVTKVYDISQKIVNESPVFYPSSPTTPTTPKIHDFSVDSPEYYSRTPVSMTKDFDTYHQVSSNDSSNLNTLSPLSISTVNELKRTTLSEKKGNSIKQNTDSVGKKKFNKIHNDDEREDKENSLKLNNNTSIVDADESDSEYIQGVNSDLDVTTDTNHQSTSNSSNESSSTCGKKDLVRRSTRLAAKPPLNYRV